MNNYSFQEPDLLAGEPSDQSDVTEVRHWIRVYSSLIDLKPTLPDPGHRTSVLARHIISWDARLDFWQQRAREITTSKVSQLAGTGP